MTDLKIVTNDFNSMAVLDMVQGGNMCAFAVDRPMVLGQLLGVIAACDAVGKEFEHSSYLNPVTLATVDNLEEEWKGGFGTTCPRRSRPCLTSARRPRRKRSNKEDMPAHRRAFREWIPAVCYKKA